MAQKICYVAIVVKDYDEAIEYYTKVLGFNLVEDTDMGNGKRWVLVSPPGSASTSILLAKAATEEQKKHVGNQTGGRVFLFLQTDDFRNDYKMMKERGVKFVEEPRNEYYATVVVFEDIYGNRWDLLQIKNKV
jgi:catechol 2,3-dioxygenase-like lactoylglutathione lyase family enzyme